ncbi:hypothetical protein TH25_13850 [Thalassospira profundimaris]|uniref:Uncharacterized protein n=2 Tax=Thalassospira profundimaris TaxID=502049 RepID=A0A367X526_9PROT|nr:hypothetical protein TH25_13850 [Thalassospira profundimaris]
MDPAMTDDGPIPPLLRQINDALTHLHPVGDSAENSGPAGHDLDVANILALLRSVVKLWGAQNAMLCGDAPLSRAWMQERLAIISQELESLELRLDDLVGKSGGEDDPSGRNGEAGTAEDASEPFELIDFANHLNHLKGRQGA